MKLIDKGNGVFYGELEKENESVRLGLAGWNRSYVEIHLPEGVGELGNKAFCFCSALKRLYLPKSVKKLRDSVFYGISEQVEIIYAGSSEEFKEIAAPYFETVDVQVPGKYDVQPYCNTEGTYYRQENRMQYFDKFCGDCQVICNDGVRLYYGYKNSDKNQNN